MLPIVYQVFINSKFKSCGHKGKASSFLSEEHVALLMHTAYLMHCSFNGYFLMRSIASVYKWICQNGIEKEKV